MRFFFTSLLRNRDAYGHPISVFYKGDDAYQTLLGGVMTLTAQILTFVLLTQAIQEMIQMEQPTINSYETVTDVDARLERGAVNLKEKGFVIAIYPYWSMKNKTTNEVTWNSGGQIPPEFGRFGAFSNNNGSRAELELVDCRSVLTEKELSNSADYF